MELKTVIILAGFLLILYVTISGALLCYQCSDTGDNEKADCFRGTRGLSLQRADHQKKNKTITKLPNVKNCSHYVSKTTGRPLYQYCKIEVVYSGGSLNAYIRDCSNGSDFSADLNVTRLSYNKRYLRPNNQSTCGYSHMHLANMCVQICEGDFCNGPLSGQTIISADTAVIILLCTLALLLNLRHRNRGLNSIL